MDFSKYTRVCLLSFAFMQCIVIQQNTIVQAELGFDVLGNVDSFLQVGGDSESNDNSEEASLAVENEQNDIVGEVFQDANNIVGGNVDVLLGNTESNNPIDELISAIIAGSCGYYRKYYYHENGADWSDKSFTEHIIDIITDIVFVEIGLIQVSDKTNEFISAVLSGDKAILTQIMDMFFGGNGTNSLSDQVIGALAGSCGYIGYYYYGENGAKWSDKNIVEHLFGLLEVIIKERTESGNEPDTPDENNIFSQILEMFLGGSNGSFANGVIEVLAGYCGYIYYYHNQIDGVAWTDKSLFEHARDLFF